jgi:hypothetical protein
MKFRHKNKTFAVLTIQELHGDEYPRRSWIVVPAGLFRRLLEAHLSSNPSVALFEAIFGRDYSRRQVEDTQKAVRGFLAERGSKCAYDYLTSVASSIYDYDADVYNFVTMHG